MKIKKQQKDEIISVFPRKIQLEWSLILQCKNQIGILKRLPILLDTLALNEISSNLIFQFNEELNRKRLKDEFQRDEAITWLENKLYLLKGSCWADHPTVRREIQKFEDALQVRDYNPLIGIVEYLWQLFKDAANAVAAFGMDLLFEGWARIKEYSCDYMQIDSISYLPSTSSFENRWQFASEINTGYTSYTFSLSNKIIYISQGYIEEFFYPTCVESILVSQSQEDWEADCTSDAITIYNFLKILSQYTLYREKKITPLTLPLKQHPETLDEVEKLYINGCIVYYLSCFDSSDFNQYPISLKELKGYIETFLTLLGSYICDNDLCKLDRQKRKERDDLRTNDAKIAKEWIHRQWADKNISHSTMASRLALAIGCNQICLSKDYKPEIYEKWAKEADPWPTDIRLHRSKAKNVKITEVIQI